MALRAATRSGTGLRFHHDDLWRDVDYGDLGAAVGEIGSGLIGLGIIITSSGKNVTPTTIETVLRERPWISQAVVYGDDRPYLAALLTLDGEEASALAERLGVTGDRTTMAHDDRVQRALQAEVDAVNLRFARIEQVKRFAVLDRELTTGRRAHADHEGQAQGGLRPLSRQAGAPLCVSRSPPRASVRLRDGSCALVRPMRGSDRPLIRVAFERLSEGSRYRRFLTPLRGAERRGAALPDQSRPPRP
jgi:hypothetical protein